MNDEAPGDNIGLRIERHVRELRVTHIQNERGISSLTSESTQNYPLFSITLPTVEYHKMLQADLVYCNLNPCNPPSGRTSCPCFGLILKTDHVNNTKNV
jgi:hypothetical protein